MLLQILEGTCKTHTGASEAPRESSLVNFASPPVAAAQTPEEEDDQRFYLGSGINGGLTAAKRTVKEKKLSTRCIRTI